MQRSALGTCIRAHKQTQQQLSVSQAQYLEEAAQRRALHNQLVDLKGAIRVFCRVRPLLAKERAARLEAATTCNLLHNSVTVTGNR